MQSFLVPFQWVLGNGKRWFVNKCKVGILSLVRFDHKPYIHMQLC